MQTHWQVVFLLLTNTTCHGLRFRQMLLHLLIKIFELLLGRQNPQSSLSHRSRLAREIGRCLLHLRSLRVDSLLGALGLPDGNEAIDTMSLTPTHV